MNDPLQLTGTTIAGKYAVESVVGEGGFAVVYKATHTIWNRPVAIKAFKALSDFTAEDRDRLLSSFVQEGALLADLSERSAAICQARDVGTLVSPSGKWIPYMVLEWLEGVTLEAALYTERTAAMGPRTPHQAMALLDPVAEALALAHKKGIAHRDVKPGNIFLLGDPRSDQCAVKLLDFGIAKVVQDAQKMAGSFAKTTGQMTSFTPAYGAPEQFSRAHGATGPWTDVFALALIFTEELLIGRDVLEGDDLAQLAYAVMDKERRPTPRTLGAPVEDALEEVMRKAVAIGIADRYQTVGEFWNALRAALGQAPMRVITGSSAGDYAARASIPSRAPLAESRPDAVAPMLVQREAVTIAQDADTSISRTTGGTKRPSRAPLAIGVGIAIAVASIGTLVAMRGKDGNASAPIAPATAATGVAAAAAVATPAGCPEGMIQIPGGKFFMGSDDKEDLPFERPAHQVTLDPYCIDRHEVTTAQYKACSDKGECKRAGSTNDWDGITAKERKTYDPLCNVRDPDAKGTHPINCVDWEQAAAYCKASGKRLPTEAEWEFSARGPDGRKFPWGDEAPSAQYLNACGKECMAWAKLSHVDDIEAMYDVDDGFATTAPVGSFPKGASRYGVEDVVGNVWEWTSDWYAPYTADALDNPKGPSKSDDGRVIRGGAWNGAVASWVRPTFRYHDVPEKRSYGIGFRCAK